MSEYRPDEQIWHKLLGSCTCELAWRERGLVDDRCYQHRLIDAVRELTARGWTVAPPVEELGALIRSAEPIPGIRKETP